MVASSSSVSPAEWASSLSRRKSRRRCCVNFPNGRPTRTALGRGIGRRAISNRPVAHLLLVLGLVLVVAPPARRLDGIEVLHARRVRPVLRNRNPVRIADGSKRRDLVERGYEGIEIRGADGGRRVGFHPGVEWAGRKGLVAAGGRRL